MTDSTHDADADADVLLPNLPNLMEACGVSGSRIKEEDLLRLSCMGTPVTIPVKMAQYLPLLERLRTSPWRRPDGVEENIPRVVEIDAPLSMFLRVYEAVCVNGGEASSDLDPSDLAFFQVEFEKPPSLPPLPPKQPLPPLPEPTTLGADTYSGALVLKIAREMASVRTPLSTTFYSHTKGTNLRNDVSWAKQNLPPHAAEYLPVSGEDQTRVVFDFPRAADVTERLDLIFYLEPDPSRMEPLPHDFVETLLVEQVSLEIGGGEILNKSGPAILMTLLADQRLLRQQRYLLEQYCDMPRDKQLEITRRGFHLTLRDIFYDLPPLFLQRCNYGIQHQHRVIVYRPSDVRGVVLRSLVMYQHFIPDAQRVPTEENSPTRHLVVPQYQWMSNQQESPQIINVALLTSNPAKLGAILVYLNYVPGVDPDVSYLQDLGADWNPFSRAVLTLNGHDSYQWCAAEMRHETWVEACGFKSSPQGLCRLAYCFPFCRKDEPGKAFPYGQIAEATLTLKDYDTANGLRRIHAVGLGFNVVRQDRDTIVLVYV